MSITAVEALALRPPSVQENGWEPVLDWFSHLTQLLYPKVNYYYQKFSISELDQSALAENKEQVRNGLQFLHSAVHNLSSQVAIQKLSSNLMDEYFERASKGSEINPLVNFLYKSGSDSGNLTVEIDDVFPRLIHYYKALAPLSNQVAEDGDGITDPQDFLRGLAKTYQDLNLQYTDAASQSFIYPRLIALYKALPITYAEMEPGNPIFTSLVRDFNGLPKLKSAQTLMHKGLSSPLIQEYSHQDLKAAILTAISSYPRTLALDYFVTSAQRDTNFLRGLDTPGIESITEALVENKANEKSTSKLIGLAESLLALDYIEAKQFAIILLNRLLRTEDHIVHDAVFALVETKIGAITAALKEISEYEGEPSTIAPDPTTISFFAKLTEAGFFAEKGIKQRKNLIEAIAISPNYTRLFEGLKPMLGALRLSPEDKNAFLLELCDTLLANFKSDRAIASDDSGRIMLELLDKLLPNLKDDEQGLVSQRIAEIFEYRSTRLGTTDTNIRTLNEGRPSMYINPLRFKDLPQGAIHHMMPVIYQLFFESKHPSSCFVDFMEKLRPTGQTVITSLALPEPIRTLLTRIYYALNMMKPLAKLASTETEIHSQAKAAIIQGLKAELKLTD